MQQSGNMWSQRIKWNCEGEREDDRDRQVFLLQRAEGDYFLFRHMRSVRTVIPLHYHVKYGFDFWILKDFFFFFLVKKMAKSQLKVFI